jgi:hypothetical protein
MWEREGEGGRGREGEREREIPGKSPSRPNMSTIISKWTCGGQLPFVGGVPTKQKG